MNPCLILIPVIIGLAGVLVWLEVRPVKGAEEPPEDEE